MNDNLAEQQIKLALAKDYHRMHLNASTAISEVHISIISELRHSL